MNADVFLPIAFTIMIVLLGLMIVISIPRGKRMLRNQEQMEANQRKQMELAERQTAAVERIADALENR